MPPFQTVTSRTSVLTALLHYPRQRTGGDSNGQSHRSDTSHPVGRRCGTLGDRAHSRDGYYEDLGPRARIWMEPAGEFLCQPVLWRRGAIGLLGTRSLNRPFCDRQHITLDCLSLGLTANL